MMSLSMKEICEQLQSDERLLKIQGLKELQRLCADEEASAFTILSAFHDCYLHLLKCYEDRFENVRDHAVQTVNQFIERMPPNDFHMMNIVSTLSTRMGQEETLEDSEEIRLQYVMQLHALIEQYVSKEKAAALQDGYREIVGVLIKAVRDAYPAVQREGCACIVTLATAADNFRFKEYAEPLAKAVYGMLNHKHSQARLAAVSALARLALHINASGEALSYLIMEVSPLLMDSMPLVREECGMFGALLLLELPDRYSYFERIIPLVLCCLKDDSPDVVDHIRLLWLKCGKQYYDENEAELSKQDLGDLQPENYPEGVTRPTIGCRGLVQRSLRLLKLITRESGDWKENVRLHSLKLLYQFVLHAEAAMTAKFFEIYPEIARACADEESTVSNEALKVADLMGRLFCYADWCEHGFDGLERNSKEGYLMCFYQMFTSSIGANTSDILRVSEILVHEDFSQSLKPQMQSYVLKMVETLLKKLSTLDPKMYETENDQEKLFSNLYVITMKVMALSFAMEQHNMQLLQDKGKSVMEQIVAQTYISVGNLHEKYLHLALRDVKNLDACLDDRSEPILLLYGLITLCKFRVAHLDLMKTLLNCVWKHATSEAKVKIFSAVSIAMLRWKETIGDAVGAEESVKLLEDFCVVVVEPHLMWHAGANSESMRSLATATLCAMSQGAYEEAGIVLPKVAHKYMTSLLEDRSTATRHYAVKCMLHFGELEVEKLKDIAYATLQRLNDPSDGARELAVKAIARLKPKFKETDDAVYERDVWHTFIRKAFDMLFLHYEGPDERLKSHIKETVVELSKIYPEICRVSFKHTLELAYNSTGLKDLESELPLNN